MRTVSGNNNVFHYSSYWRSWSRVLFHAPLDSKAGDVMRKEFGIPASVHTVEVNVWGNELDRIQRNADIIIRRHSTNLWNDYDRLSMALPEEVSESIHSVYSKTTRDLILHVDLLNYIDFKKMVFPVDNGGCALKDCLKDGLIYGKVLELISAS